MKNIMVIVISVSLILGLSISVNAGWVLYDDFNSGTINTQLWWEDESSAATISIENGELKFVHPVGHPNTSFWLEIIDNPENIIGIRTKIRVQSCTGDVRGRIGGWVGKLDNNEIWSTMDVRASEGRIVVYAGYEPSSQEWFNLFHTGFYYNWENPLDIIGKNFVIEWMFKPDEIIGKTDSYGENIYKYPERVLPHESSFKAIGTRSNPGEGPCVFYFDDVYVYRQTPSAARNLLLLDDK